MDGHSATSAAQIIGICRQSVSTYVQIFNSDGIEGLLERRYPPGCTPYLSSSEETEIRNILMESTPNQEGLTRSAVGYLCSSISIRGALPCFYV